MSCVAYVINWHKKRRSDYLKMGKGSKRAKVTIITTIVLGIVVIALLLLFENRRAMPSAPPHDLTLLPVGPHAGLDESDWGISAETLLSRDSKVAEAISHGMDVAKIQVDWVNLEPDQEGVYDQNLLANLLDANNNQGRKTFVLICAFEGEGFEAIPARFRDGEGNLLPGKHIDDEDILEAYRNLLDWAVPMIVSKGGYVLSVANEPEALIEDQIEGKDNIVNFVQNAVDHSHSISNELAVGVTLSGTWESSPAHSDLLAPCDVMIWNVYNNKMVVNGKDLSFNVPDPATYLTPIIDELLLNSEGRYLVLQEAGSSAGYDSGSGINGTQEKQRATVEVMFDLLDSRPNFRVWYWWPMIDWSEETGQYMVDVLQEEGLPQGFIDDLKEVLRTGGLITFENGKARLAWDEFLAGQDMISGSAPEPK